MEPKDKNSMEWKEWFVRHTFGAMTAESIKIATVKDLNVLIEFVQAIQREREGNFPKS